MRAISLKVKKQILADPFYERCCITGLSANEAKIDWHHNLKYAGKQVNEKWAILPLASHYQGKSFHQYHEGITPEVQERLDWIMLNRATEEELRKYSKCVDLVARRKKLNEKHGFLTPYEIDSLKF
jgi:diadenosine tetraphosphatase ApaH/serine/threonine PP2A family protein phosphatase